MSRIVKWTLAIAILIVALAVACVRISDAIDDAVMEMHNNSRIEQVEPQQPSADPAPQPSEPAPAPTDQRPWLNDRLDHT